MENTPDEKRYRGRANDPGNAAFNYAYVKKAAKDFGYGDEVLKELEANKHDTEALARIMAKARRRTMQ